MTPYGFYQNVFSKREKMEESEMKERRGLERKREVKREEGILYRYLYIYNVLMCFLPGFVCNTCMFLYGVCVSVGVRVIHLSFSTPDATFVDDNRAELIQMVTMVMPISDDLLQRGIILDEAYSNISVPRTRQEQMRELFKALNTVKVKSRWIAMDRLRALGKGEVVC
uniref:CARD domain-containing protein n=1 Tax=Hucho hucho TaxID=62062 RepID=A0A4W5RQ83_9TELE